jgi:hypothetical protein
MMIIVQGIDLLTAQIKQIINVRVVTDRVLATLVLILETHTTILVVITEEATMTIKEETFNLLEVVNIIVLPMIEETTTIRMTEEET